MYIFAHLSPKTFQARDNEGGKNVCVRCVYAAHMPYPANTRR